MKILILSAFILLAPCYIYSQEVFPEKRGLSSVVKATYTSSTENYHLITPVLLRDFSTLNSSDKSTLHNGNEFYSFFSSLVVPGAGQVLNRNWWKAGLFAAIEATSVYLYFRHRNSGRNGERNFEEWTNENWSVVQYSDWLVKYHEVNGLTNPHIDELRSMVNNVEASFDVEQDWEKVDLDVLRDVERNTPYITPDSQAARNFSHVLPDYGTQQYYELVSKYYQYQAGWKDYDDFHDGIGHTGSFHNNRFLIDRNGAYSSPFFYHGAQTAEQFNTDFRRSGYFLSILIANHVISAFDAYFTFMVKQNRLQATSSIMPGKQITLTYRF